MIWIAKGDCQRVPKYACSVLKAYTVLLYVIGGFSLIPLKIHSLFPSILSLTLDVEYSGYAEHGLDFFSLFVLLGD